MGTGLTVEALFYCLITCDKGIDGTMDSMPYGKQLNFWRGKFGQDYTDRCTRSPRDIDKLYVSHYGTSRSRFNQRFIGNLPRSTRILEVGANSGGQLKLLQDMGFTKLTGIEPQRYAIKVSNASNEGITLIEGSAFDLPFDDASFDLVFTSGVLIHIPPDQLHRAMDEMVRVTAGTVWGFEYYAEQMTEVEYRGNTNALWKADYGEMFRIRYPQLEMIRKELIPYLKGDNIDCMYLLQKITEEG